MVTRAGRHSDCILPRILQGRQEGRQAGIQAVFFPGPFPGAVLESAPTSRVTKSNGPFPHTYILHLLPLWESAGQCGVGFGFFLGNDGLGDVACWGHSGP